MKKFALLMILSLVGTHTFAYGAQSSDDSSSDDAPVVKKTAKKKKHVSVDDETATSAAAPQNVADMETVSSGSSAFSGTVIHPLFGFAFMNPKALNNALQNLNNSSSFKIGTANDFGIGAEYPVARNFYVGVRVEYFTSSSDSVNLGKGTAQASMAGLPVMATLSYVVPVARKFSIGATAGAGWAFAYNSSIAFNNVGTAAPNGTLSYGSTPFTGMGLAFANYDFTRAVALRLEAGYRFLTSSQMKQTDSYNGSPEGTLMTDPTNGNTNLVADSSSFFSGLSLAVTL